MEIKILNLLTEAIENLDITIGLLHAASSKAEYEAGSGEYCDMSERQTGYAMLREEIDDILNNVKDSMKDLSFLLSEEETENIHSIKSKKNNLEENEKDKDINFDDWPEVTED